MPSAIAAIRRLDAARPATLPLVPNPAPEALMVAPYWGDDCYSDEHETNLPGAAALLASAWCQTGGKRQHKAVVALLECGGMGRAAARELADRARQTVGEPGHAGVVAELRGELAAGVAAWG